MFRGRSGRQAVRRERREEEGEGHGQPEQDPDDPSSPRRDIDRAERLLRMGVIVVPMVVAVVVGRVMGHRAGVTGHVDVVLNLCHV